MNDEPKMSLDGLTKEKIAQRLVELKAEKKQGKQTSGWVQVDKDTSQRVTISNRSIKIETKQHLRKGEGAGDEIKN